jgi:hypothetical protein
MGLPRSLLLIILAPVGKGGYIAVVVMVGILKKSSYGSFCIYRFMFIWRQLARNQWT